MPDSTHEQAIRLALQCLHNGLLAEAQAICREVLGQDPNHADALRLLGVAARKEGRGDEAVELIRRSIAINPKHAETHQNLGDAFRSQGNLEAAIDAYLWAIQLSPSRAEALGAI